MEKTAELGEGEERTVKLILDPTEVRIELSMRRRKDLVGTVLLSI